MRDWLSDRWQAFLPQPFLSDGAATYSYADLDRAVRSARTELAQGDYLPGEKVLLLSDYSLNGIAWLLALWWEGFTVVPVTPAAKAERTHRQRISQATLALDLSGPSPSFERLAGAGDSTGEPPGLLLFSSGTTGEPKAMRHDLDRLGASYQSKKVRPLAVLVFLLFDHIGGLHTLFTSLASGMHLVVPSNRDPHTVVSLIQQYRVQLLPTSPTFLNLFLQSGAADRHDLSSLRIISYGTESMPASLLARLHATFPRIKLLQTFGTSETGIVQTISRSSSSLEIKIQDPEVETRIVDGELWLRTAHNVSGYLNADSSRFTEDGWFRTGDLVEETGDGFFRILGRLTEIINVGGEKVSPIEVESVLGEIPGVKDSLVMARPHPLLGEVVSAEILVDATTETEVLKRAIKKHCRQRMLPYKVPVYMTFVSTFGDRLKQKKSRRPQ